MVKRTINLEDMRPITSGQESIKLNLSERSSIARYTLRSTPCLSLAVAWPLCGMGPSARIPHAAKRYASNLVQNR